jgi:hypothetical protein
MGVVGRLTLGDVRGLSDAEVDTLVQALPILAIGEDQVDTITCHCMV